MPKKPEAYYRPETVAEALRLLAQPRTVALAGGTHLLASEAGLGDAVVDLQGLGLDQIELRDGALFVGAMVTLARLARYLTEQQSGHGVAALLHEGIHRAGPNTYRNAATMGGIVASRLPDSEMLAALLVLDTAVHFANADQVPLDLATFLADAARPSGLITALAIPWTAGEGANERVARTPADYPIVSITAWRPAGQAPRLAATGIAPRPLRVPLAEAQLAGELTEETISSAAVTVRETAVHPGDFRGDAAYRAEMAAVLTQRLLRQFLAR